jgi:outer membrane protein assembly factor BamB
MNQPTRALAALILTAATASAQESSALYTHPTVPSDDALQRLNLKLGWRTYIPMDGRRDTIFSVQHAGDLLLVQTRSGLVCAIEAETGRSRWQVRVGRPYRVSVRLGYNARAVLVVNDQTLYVLNRETGALLWDFDMPSAVTTAPLADDRQVFLSLRGGTVSAYSIPKPNPDVVAKSTAQSRKEPEKAPEPRVVGSGVRITSSIGALASATGKGTRAISNVGPLSSAREITRIATSGVEPRLDWSDSSGLRLEVAPLQTPDTLFLVGVNGRIAALAKGVDRSLHYNHFVADDIIVVPPGQHEDEAYVASQDSNLYRVQISTGRVLWRFTTGTPVRGRPAVTDDDVYISTDRGGLRRLERRTGQSLWQNRAADRFLAVNPKAVYATDSSGRLLILDRGSGGQVGSYDARDFVVPINNDLTDRIYLAANDGLLVCLHDRDYAKPHVNKKWDLKKEDVKKRGDKMQAMPKPKAPAENKDTAGDKDKADPLEKKQ